MDLAPGELLVGRTWRWDVDRLAADVEIDRRDKLAEGISNPPPALSVFAVAHAAETVGQTAERLRWRIRQHRNAKWITFVTQSELEAIGCSLELAEPPPDHHDLLLGQIALPDAIVALFDIFNARERERL